jgi:ribosomal protein S18 acetylase RimI-like enzyme
MALGDLRIELRPETGDDGEFLARLYRDARAEEMAQWGWPPEQQALFLNMQFEAQRRGFRQSFPKAAGRIVRVGDADAGRMLVAEETLEIHLVDIALLQEYRGRGVGTELLTGLQRECERRGLPLRLQVLVVNPARRLYRRMGFDEVSADSMYVRMEWRPSLSSEGI